MMPFSANLSNIVRAAAFFVALPVVFSLHSGIFQTGFGQFLPQRISIYFWACMWLSTWWSCEILLYALTAILRPWNLSLPIRILAAGAISIVASRYYTPELLKWFAHYGSDVPLDNFIANSSFFDVAHLVNLFGSGAPGLIAWAGSRLLYNHLRENSDLFQKRDAAGPNGLSSDLPHREELPTKTVAIKDSAARQESAKHSTKLEAVISKLGIQDLSEVLALRAEDHYVWVVLKDRSELISYRFAEILEGFAQQDGLRVHRSHWISRAAVESVRQKGGSLAVRTYAGDEVPVSMKYRAMFDHWYGNGCPESV
jgi:hypothetical protein